MKPGSSVVLAFVLATFTTGPIGAQFKEVGSIDFPTSATGEAQQAFLRGVAILHSFGWKQAIAQFQEAQKADPDFALAFWGESLAYNHPLNSRMNADEPRAVLARLGASRAARLAKAPTEREQGLLGAVEILWGEGDHVDRRLGYMDAMARLHDRYPDDSEIAAFYALSMLSAVAATRDLSRRLNVRAGAIALGLMQKNPNHPGAPHYAIHSFDSPLHAPLALEAAYRFSEIAPAVSHARHMPTHIFIQHGMWDRVSGNNQSAYDAAKDLWEPGDNLGDAIHALDWGQYGDLQRGDYERARLWADRLGEIVETEGFYDGGARGAAGVARARNAVPLLRARYIVDTEEWDVQPISDESSAHELLATGLSASRTGQQAVVQSAEAALKELSESSDDQYTQIMLKQVGALTHAGLGHGDVATGLMDEAVELLGTMAPPRGSASPVKPVHELYGELLLDLGRPAEAIEMFETSLELMPNRPRSLLGLARACAAEGDAEGAAEAYAQLAEVWRGHDALEGMKEARRFLASAQEP